MEPALYTHVGGGMTGSARFKMGAGKWHLSIRWKAISKATLLNRQRANGTR